METRVDLPLVWAEVAHSWEQAGLDLGATAWELTRRLGRPPPRPGRETLALSLKQVPGLQSVWWNGEELPVSSDSVKDASEVWFSLPESAILPRNEVRLCPRPGDWWVRHSERWGVVTLEIHDIGTGAGPEAEGRPDRAF